MPAPPTEKIKPNKQRVSSDEPQKNEKMRTKTASQRQRHGSTDTNDRVQVKQNQRKEVRNIRYSKRDETPPLK
jgi:hypothetical protein